MALPVLLLFAVSARAGDAAPRTLPVQDVGTLAGDALPEPGQTPYLGVISECTETGLRAESVLPGSPGALAGLLAGDVVLRVGGLDLGRRPDLADRLAMFAPGDRVRLDVRRDDERLDLDVRLGSRRVPDGTFHGREYHLLVVPLVFDGEAADDPAFVGLDELFFATHADTTERSAADGSVAEYLATQSFGACELSGRVLAPLRIAGSRSELAQEPMGGRRGSLYHRAALLLAARDGLDALTGIDGLAFVTAGALESRPGLALWPHRSEVLAGGVRLPYFVHPVQAGRGEIGGHCHELGHMLGLCDEYGVGHRTGSGDFCLMALGHRGGPERGARAPFSLCAPCRLRLGWLRPVVLDPRIARRVRLRPVDRAGGDSEPGCAVVVPMDRRTGEYLVLEARRRAGGDRELPSEGLLVWHVGGPGTPGQGAYRSRLDLIEAHGVDTFDAALVRTGEIAFPTPRARDLTRETRPSIRGRDGAYPVCITDIVREEDGSVCFTLGAPRTIRQEAPFPYVPTARERDGAVVRPDPVTGAGVRFYPNRLRTPDLPVGSAGER